jgi:hypothetical protein
VVGGPGVNNPSRGVHGFTLLSNLSENLLLNEVKGSTWGRGVISVGAIAEGMGNLLI